MRRVSLKQVLVVPNVELPETEVYWSHHGLDRAGFAGRHEQLALLEADRAEVRSSRRGRFGLVRGRRQVGKSRLVEEFIDRSGAPSVFFTATKGRSAALELNEFTRLMRHPSIDVDHALADTTFGSWDAAPSALARTMKVPTVVVVDEIPYLFAGARADAETVPRFAVGDIDRSSVDRR